MITSSNLEALLRHISPSRHPAIVYYFQQRDAAEVGKVRALEARCGLAGRDAQQQAYYLGETDEVRAA